MTLLVAFYTALLIVYMMAQVTLQISTTFVQRKEPTYHFYYNVNESNAGLRQRQEEMGNRKSANSEGYFVVNSDGSRQNSDHKTYTEHQNYNFVPKNPDTIFSTPQKPLIPNSPNDEASHPGYPRWGRPMGPQFNPAPGVPQTRHRLIPGYEREKLPPGYVALVAKIDTPKGYKLLNEKY